MVRDKPERCIYIPVINDMVPCLREWKEAWDVKISRPHRTPRETKLSCLVFAHNTVLGRPRIGAKIFEAL